MGKKYLYAHVTPSEEDVFDRYTPVERKVMYARRVLQRNPSFSLYKLNKILKWKFGTGVGHNLYKQIKESI
jgi:hypothetical protein